MESDHTQLLQAASRIGQCTAGNDARVNHASGIQAPLTRMVATPCYRAPEVSPPLLQPAWLVHDKHMHNMDSCMHPSSIAARFTYTDLCGSARAHVHTKSRTPPVCAGVFSCVSRFSTYNCPSVPALQCLPSCQSLTTQSQHRQLSGRARPLQAKS